MDEQKFVPDQEGDKDGLEIAPEEEGVKGQSVTYQPKKFEEPSIEEKIDDFIKESRTSVFVKNVAELFFNSYPNDSIKFVGESVTKFADYLKGIDSEFDKWLTAHSYKPATPQDHEKIMKILEESVFKSAKELVAEPPRNYSEETSKEWIRNMQKKKYWFQLIQNIEQIRNETGE